MEDSFDNTKRHTVNRLEDMGGVGEEDVDVEMVKAEEDEDHCAVPGGVTVHHKHSPSGRGRSRRLRLASTWGLKTFLTQSVKNLSLLKIVRGGGGMLQEPFLTFVALVPFKSLLCFL